MARSAASPSADDPALRASDAERERVVAALRAHCAAGRLSVEELAERSERAYAARTLADLAALTFDLPPPPVRGAALRAVLTRIGGALAAPEPPAPAPGPPSDPLRWSGPRRALIGRGPHCDVDLRDPTVSRRHAELRLEPAGWVLEDLASLNGVVVNGRRVDRTVLRAGDEVVLGEARMRFEPEPSSPRD